MNYEKIMFCALIIIVMCLIIISANFFSKINELNKKEFKIIDFYLDRKFLSRVIKNTNNFWNDPKKLVQIIIEDATIYFDLDAFLIINEKNYQKNTVNTRIENAVLDFMEKNASIILKELENNTRKTIYRIFKYNEEEYHATIHHTTTKTKEVNKFIIYLKKIPHELSKNTIETIEDTINIIKNYL